MADGAGKLDKLARLKNLKSGLKAKGGSSGGDREDLSLDAMLGGSDAASPAIAPKYAAAAPSKKGEKEGESLSAYFEALGIVPDGAKLAGATGMAPKPYAPPSDAYTNAAEEPGRDVDARDRWPDPVREDDAFLTSFAGVVKEEEPEKVPEPVRAPEPARAVESAKVEEPEEDDDELSLEAIIGSFEEDEDESPVAKVKATAAIVDDPKEVVELTVEDMLAEELAAEPPKQPSPVPSAEPLEESLAELELELESDPDAFGQPVDIEAFEREIGLADSKPAPKSEPEPVASSTDATPDQPLSITFDETRATLLAHVSKQMNCSIDDVVVTAIDWYLDALFGEDDPEMKADAAE